MATIGNDWQRLATIGNDDQFTALYGTKVYPLFELDYIRI